MQEEVDNAVDEAEATLGPQSLVNGMSNVDSG